MGLALVCTSSKIQTANLTEKRSSWSFLAPLFSSGMGNCLDWPLRTVRLIFCSVMPFNNLTFSICLVALEIETCEVNWTVVQCFYYFFRAVAFALSAQKSDIILQKPWKIFVRLCF